MTPIVQFALALLLAPWKPVARPEPPAWTVVHTGRGPRMKSPRTGKLFPMPIMGGDGTDPPTAVLEKLTATLERLEQTDEQRQADIKAAVDAAIAKLNAGDPETPSKTVEKADDIRVYDRFDEMWGEHMPRGISESERARQMRANYELAMMVFGGTWRMTNPVRLYPPEDLVRGWVANVFERGTPPAVTDANGKVIRKLDPQPVLDAIKNQRAMDTAETGYGLELVGAQYVRDLWTAARNMDSIVGDIRTIPMTDPTVYVPIDGDLPEMLFVGESTSASATAYDTSKTASSRVTLTAKKFTIQQIWSGEMEEDSIIAFTPFLREKLNMSAALHLGSAYYNGDTTNAGTGNINLDDANPADTKHYLAWNGIRYYWITTATGQGKSMAATLDPHEIDVARGKLNGADDDVDNAIKNINWGQDPRNLRLVADWDTYMAMLDIDDVRTVDKYGPQATVITGELASYRGIPIISPSYATKTEADFKCSTTEASNTKGQITVFAPQGWLGGVRREVQLFFDRIQRTDQFLFELYTRRAFTRFGGNVAAGIGNITL